VLCEVDPETKDIIRILRKGGAALFLKPEQVMEYPKAEAVKLVRKRVFEIDRYSCRHCGKLVTWLTGHCDEVIPKGKSGEVSIYNCQTLCSDCHIGPKGKHGNRYPQWSRA